MRAHVLKIGSALAGCIAFAGCGANGPAIGGIATPTAAHADGHGRAGISLHEPPWIF